MIAQAHIDNLLLLTPPISSDSLSSLKVPLSAKSTTSSIRSNKTTSSKVSLPLANAEDDLDTPDELAIRALLLGINYRTLEAFDKSRTFLNEAYAYQSVVRVSTWVGGVAMFELAVLDLKEAEGRDRKRGVEEEEGIKNSPPTAATATMNGSAHEELSSGTDTQGLSNKISKLALDLDRVAPPSPTTQRQQFPAPLSESARKSLWTEVLKGAIAKLDVALSLATSSVDLSSRLDSRIAMLRDEIALKKDMVGVAF